VDTTRGAPSRVGPFARHYLEMVVAMAVGMVAYGLLFRGNVFSRSLVDEAVMGAFMTASMVAWMRYRGHAWRQAAEMSVAMLAAVFLAAAGQAAVSDRALMLATHAAMLVGMLVLMLARRGEYAHANHQCQT
jgi:ethanolamine ammonia-lyase large subunit